MRRLGAVLIGLVLAAGAAGNAGAEEATFDVTLRGVKVAELQVAGSEGGDSYSVAVAIRSDGLAGVVRRFRFQSSSAGRLDDGFRPLRYAETVDTGKRQSEAEIVYKRGVPQVIRYASPRPDTAEVLDPATQGGTLDPATALYAGLRDRAPGAACALDIAVFDGRRRSETRIAGEGLVCTGTYRRVAGYTPDEMAERSVFPLEVVYAAEGDVLRVIEASAQTIYGKVRLKRR